MSELSEKRSEQNDGFSINFNQDYTYVSLPSSLINLDWLISSSESSLCNFFSGIYFVPRNCCHFCETIYRLAACELSSRLLERVLPIDGWKFKTKIWSIFVGDIRTSKSQIQKWERIPQHLFFFSPAVWLARAFVSTTYLLFTIHLTSCIII